jgi:hypothetical protein
MKLSEEFLYYVWQNKLFFKEDFYDSDGNKIEVIETGKRNTDSGPDFFYSKIKIDDTLWAGNVEIHINSSDWNKHGHSSDKSFDNVILHIVINKDSETYRTNGEKIPVAVLKFDNSHFERYRLLVSKNGTIPCFDFIKDIDSFVINSWLSALLYERLENKTEYVREISTQTKNNKEETFYILTAKAFGFNVNGLPFELLAKSLPLNILAKHKSNLFQIEALLFGQSGLLSEIDCEDEYFKNLKKEYQFLKTKYSLKEIDGSIWKFMRMRPANFPTIRISQFANLVFLSSHLYSKILEAESIEKLENYFQIKASEYWDTHYTFGKLSDKKIKHFGNSAIKNLIINTIIPTLFIFGKDSGNEEISEKAITFLENSKTESNNIITEWEKTGVTIKSAFDSQAIIHLYKNYCQNKKCLNCRIGQKII